MLASLTHVRFTDLCFQDGERLRVNCAFVLFSLLLSLALLLHLRKNGRKNNLVCLQSAAWFKHAGVFLRAQTATFLTLHIWPQCTQEIILKRHFEKTDWGQAEQSFLSPSIIPRPFPRLWLRVLDVRHFDNLNTEQESDGVTGTWCARGFLQDGADGVPHLCCRSQISELDR